MFIYNITIKTDWRIQEAWLAWVQEVFIAEAMKSRCFSHYLLVRLREVDEEEGPTYAIQLYADDRLRYNTFTERFLPQLEARSFDKWGNNVLSFGTLMELVKKGEQ